MGELLVIVPTRGRPDNAFRLARSFATTCRADTELVFVVDDDDPCREEYLQADLEPGLVLTTERRRLGPTLNWATFGFGDAYHSVGFMGDDHLPRTEGWDIQVVGALELLGSGFAYGNDLNQGERLPTACFMTMDVVRALGYMVPAGLIHLYIDDAWRVLGQRMGRLTYLPDVIIEHLHPTAGKADTDASYAESNSPQMYSEDNARFHAWVESPDGLARDAARLQAL